MNKKIIITFLMLLITAVSLTGIPATAQNKPGSGSAGSSFASQLAEVLNSNKIEKIDVEEYGHFKESKILSNNTLMLKDGEVIMYVNINNIWSFRLSGQTLFIRCK